MFVVAVAPGGIARVRPGTTESRRKSCCSSFPPAVSRCAPRLTAPGVAPDASHEAEPVLLTLAVRRMGVPGETTILLTCGVIRASRPAPVALVGPTKRGSSWKRLLTVLNDGEAKVSV